MYNAYHVLTRALKYCDKLHRKWKGSSYFQTQLAGLLIILCINKLVVRILVILVSVSCAAGRGYAARRDRVGHAVYSLKGNKNTVRWFKMYMSRGSRVIVVINSNTWFPGIKTPQGRVITA